jgi:hypothetical protein
MLWTSQGTIKVDSSPTRPWTEAAMVEDYVARNPGGFIPILAIRHGAQLRPHLVDTGGLVDSAGRALRVILRRGAAGELRQVDAYWQQDSVWRLTLDWAQDKKGIYVTRAERFEWSHRRRTVVTVERVTER